MSRRLQLIQDEFEQSENAHKETKYEDFVESIYSYAIYLFRVTFSKYSSNLRVTVNQIRKEYSFLQESYSKNFQNWKMYLQTMENTLQKEIQSMMNNYRIEIEQYQHQLKYEEKCKNSDLILILVKHNNLNLNPKNLIQRMTIIIYYQFSFFI